MQTPENKDNRKWYPLRVTYGRELKVSQQLMDEGWECFLPMTIRVVEKDGKNIKKKVPVVNNLLFLHISEEDMCSLKKDTQLPIRYIMDKSTKRPIVIPNKQMEDFIRVAGTDGDTNGVYISPDELKLAKGTRVRIVAGPLMGVEGMLMRIKHDRRVVVQIDNMLAIGTAYVKMEWLDMVEK